MWGRSSMLGGARSIPMTCPGSRALRRGRAPASSTWPGTEAWSGGSARWRITRTGCPWPRRSRPRTSKRLVTRGPRSSSSSRKRSTDVVWCDDEDLAGGLISFTGKACRLWDDDGMSGPTRILGVWDAPARTMWNNGSRLWVTREELRVSNANGYGRDRVLRHDTPVELRLRQHMLGTGVEWRSDGGRWRRLCSYLRTSGTTVPVALARAGWIAPESQLDPYPRRSSSAAASGVSPAEAGAWSMRSVSPFNGGRGRPSWSEARSPRSGSCLAGGLRPWRWSAELTG